MLHQSERKEQVKERAKIVKSTDQCFKCGELGHWAVTLTIQLLRLHEVTLQDNPTLVQVQAKGTNKANDERLFEQGTEEWKKARKGKVNGSKAAVALGK